MNLPIPVNESDHVIGPPNAPIIVVNYGDYHNGINYGITGAPTTFINDELYAMSGVDLLSTVKTMLEST
jgi:protein-disulfide isomerase